MSQNSSLDLLLVTMLKRGLAQHLADVKHGAFLLP